MATKIEIGTRVNGNGTISNIITKSTGYVEVTYDNGKVKKEMAFNLVDENGVALKRKPVVSERKYDSTAAFNRNLKIALENEHGRTGLSLEDLKKL